MKKNFLILILLSCLQLNSSSQNINIPDTIFRNYLLAMGVDQNGNGQITIYEASHYYGEILVDSMNIFDLTGIEYFIHISKLSATGNHLSFLFMGNHYYLNSLIVDNNLIDTIYLSICDNLKVLSCKHNNLNQILLPGQIEYLDCSNNNFDTLELENYNELHYLNCSNNDLTLLDIFEINYLDTVICTNNNLTEINLPYSFQLKYLDISFNPDFQNLCVNQLPLDFVLHNEGIDDYKISLCLKEYQDVFRAGQYISTFNLDTTNRIIFFNTPIGFDLTADGIKDIEFSTHYQGNQWYGECWYYLKPINQSFMVGSSYFLNDTLYPLQNSLCSDSVLLSYVYGDYYGGIDSIWYPEGHYFEIITPGELDTIYSYAYVDNGPGINYFSLELNPSANWIKCPSSSPFNLGTDTVISVKDTLTLIAGSGYDAYLWNTKDTTESVTVIGQQYSTGIRDFLVWVKQGHCYFSDTIQVQIIDDSGIKNQVTEAPEIFPNPTYGYVNIISNNRQNEKINLYDTDGRILESYRCLEREITFDISQYHKGLYFLELITGNITYRYKILKL